MESRDFSRDGASAGVEVVAEEEGILPVTASLAKDSALLFQSGLFKECADVLDSLLTKKNGDPKVRGRGEVLMSFGWRGSWGWI